MDDWTNDASGNRSAWFLDPEAAFYLLVSRAVFALVPYRGSSVG